jgi:hypothetical protein
MSCFQEHDFASLAKQQAEMAAHSDKLKVLLVLGSIRDGRQGLKVAKFVRKQLENRNFDVIIYGKGIGYKNIIMAFDNIFFSHTCSLD